MLRYNINPSGADSNHIPVSQVDSIATNALVPCVDRSSAAMILTEEK